MAFTEQEKPAALTAERIVEAAQRGEKITPAERRHAVAWLMVTEPSITNSELSKMFAVSERSIRLDRNKVRKQKARLLKQDDVSLIISDIIMDFERNVRDIEQSKKNCTKGTKNYLEHCQAIVKMRLQVSEALQALGWLPKSLGHLQVHKYNYQSSVSKDGVVETRKVETFTEDAPILEAEEVKALPAPEEQVPIAPSIELGKELVLDVPDYLKDTQ